MALCKIIINRSNAEEKSNRAGETYEGRGYDLGIYALLTIMLIVLGLVRAIVFFKIMIDTANGVHLKMFSSLMRAPLFFFDTNSAGMFILFVLLSIMRSLDRTILFILRTIDLDHSCG